MGSVERRGRAAFSPLLAVVLVACGGRYAAGDSGYGGTAGTEQPGAGTGAGSATAGGAGVSSGGAGIGVMGVGLAGTSTGSGGANPGLPATDIEL